MASVARRVERAVAACWLALVLALPAVPVRGAALPPPPPRPPVRRPPVRRPTPTFSSIRGELPAGPETPAEQLPAQYFGALGQTHLQYKQWSKAEEAYQQAYAKEKDAARRVQYAYNLGRLHMRKKEYEKALPFLKAAADGAPDTSRSYDARYYRTVLAGLLEKMERFKEAEEVYQEWVKKAGEGYQRTMARRELLRFWHRAGKLDAAIAVYEGTLRVKPGDKEALETLRLIYTSIKPDAGKALAVAEKLAEADPDDRDAALYLLSAFERAKKYDKAIALIQRLVDKHPADTKHLSSRLVYLYVQSGQKDKAVAHAKAMLEKGPKTADLHSRAASIYQQLSMVEEALEQYEAAAGLAKRPADRERYLYSAALTARRAKKYEKAEGFAMTLVNSESKLMVRQAKRLLFELYEEQNKLDQLQIAPRKPKPKPKATP